MGVRCTSDSRRALRKAKWLDEAIRVTSGEDGVAAKIGKGSIVGALVRVVRNGEERNGKNLERQIEVLEEAHRLAVVDQGLGRRRVRDTRQKVILRG